MQLGEKTPLPANPLQAILECVPNRATRPYIARFTTPEFSSLCPVTGQPDYATIVIDYVPGSHLVESKSLKLLLGSFRNHGAFHEECINTLFNRIWSVAQPTWLRVAGFFTARGGISIDVVVEEGELPAVCRPLPTDVSIYLGRK